MAEDNEASRKWNSQESRAEGPYASITGYYARRLIFRVGDWRRLHGCSVTTEENVVVFSVHSTGNNKHTLNTADISFLDGSLPDQKTFSIYKQRELSCHLR